MDDIGTSALLAIVAGACLAALAVTLAFRIETRGRALDEVSGAELVPLRPRPLPHLARHQHPYRHAHAVDQTSGRRRRPTGDRGQRRGVGGRPRAAGVRGGAAVVVAKTPRLAGGAAGRRGAREVSVMRPGQASGGVMVHAVLRFCYSTKLCSI